SALKAGENCGIYLLRKFGIVGQDESAAGTAKGLVGRGCRDMGMRKRTWVNAARDEPSKMGHVHEQICADLIGDFPEALKVDDTGIGRSAGNDETRFVLSGEPRYLLIINNTVLTANAIMNGIKPFAGHIRRGAMSEMASGINPHSKDR